MIVAVWGPSAVVRVMRTTSVLQTVIQAYTVGVVVTYFEQFVVLQALVLTVAVVAGLTAYTFQTKRDFSSIGGL